MFPFLMRTAEAVVFLLAAVAAWISVFGHGRAKTFFSLWQRAEEAKPAQLSGHGIVIHRRLSCWLLKSVTLCALRLVLLEMVCEVDAIPSPHIVSLGWHGHGFIINVFGD